MPELPDVLLYVEHLERLLAGRPIRKVQVISPFVLQTAQPSIQEAVGRVVTEVSRIGKRIVWRMGEPAGAGSVAAAAHRGGVPRPSPGDLLLVFHLMIAGRFHLKKPGTAVPRKTTLIAFEIDSGLLLFTEAATRKRATLHVIRGEAGLTQFDRGGLDVLEADFESFRERLQIENHTLKRALSDPGLFD